ncbi:MAG TPA: hypothetical protein VM164_02810 [Burkholderiales bacterium]|nr:hypothetical protein [Burkholderiales bacterium]
MSLLVCLLVGGLCAWGYLTGTLAATFSDLYEHQIAKVRALDTIDTVFVGDSSLGNAIDARHWEQLSGRPAVNLSLSGAYGYAGSLNMLRRVLRKARPRAVFIFQTIDMFTRPIEHEAYLRSAVSLRPLLEVPPGVTLKVYVNLDTALAVLRRLAFPAEAGKNIDYARDVARQSPTAASVEERYRGRHLRLQDVRPEKLNYLRRLAALCTQERLDCTYVHGPLVESTCRGSADYLDEVNRLIDSTGLPRAKQTPVCLLYADVGDTEDHVRPERRRYYTERYFERLSGSR